jgi:TolB-like protein
MTEPIPEAEKAEPLNDEKAASIPPTDLWERIKEHKVLQWSLTYFGASLALAHAQDLLSHTYHWPELVGRLLIGVLIVGFPIALAMAWYHGHKGLKQISAGEMTVVSILLVIGAGLLIALVRAPTELTAPLQVHESAPPPSVALAASAASQAPAETAALGSPPALAAAKKPRLAILPFENLSPDPANAFFTDGLHEEILATLAQRAPGLEVISRTTMMMYRLKPEPIAQVARELGATHVIEGSVRRDGKQVRLTLQLIDAHTDEHIWAQDYDRTLTHALTLQSEVANEVASQLSVQLAGGAEAAKPLTRDPEAYDLYLKALLKRGAAAEAFTVSALQEVDDLLTAAIARDPTFAAAYAERSGIRMVRFLLNVDASEVPLRQDRADVETAVRLVPGDPKVLGARAIYLELTHDPAGALAVFRQAEAAGLADPIFSVAKANSLMDLSRCAEAIQVYKQALPLNSLDPFVLSNFAATQALCRQPIEALRALDFAINQLPDAGEIRVARSYVLYAFTGTTDELNSPQAPDSSAIPNILRPGGIEWDFDRLRWTQRYPELQQLLGHGSGPVVPGPFFGSGAGAAERPIALYRGWLHLLLGDRSEAVRDGAAVLDFVTHRKENQWNRALLWEFTAEGYTFEGDITRALPAARSALNLVRPAGDPSRNVSPFNLRLAIERRVAAIFAWNGAQDEAAQLLEQLATTIPGPGPAEITRDPLYTTPLAHNAHYQQLVARLEAQMRATKLQ